jgi:hypothetical protein
MDDVELTIRSIAGMSVGCLSCKHYLKIRGFGDWRGICKANEGLIGNRTICSGTALVHTDEHLRNYCSCDGRDYQARVSSPQGDK